MPVPTDTAVITFAAPEVERPRYQPMIDRFHAEQSAVQVQFVALEDALSTSGQPQNDGSARTLVSAADTAIGAIRPSDIASGYVRDLQPYIDADPSFQPDDYYPRALEPLRTDGGRHILPQTAYVPLLYANRQLCPGLSATADWDALLARAEQCARADSTIDVYGLMDGEEGRLVFQHELERAGVPLFALPPEQAQLTAPAVVAALEQVRTLVQRGALYAQVNSDSTEAFYVSSEDVERLVRTQRLAIWRAGAFPLDHANPDFPFDIGVALLPEPAQPSSPPASYGYLMSAGTQHPEAAWRWLSFLSRQPTGPTGNPFDVPARRSLAEQNRYWETVGEQQARLMRQYLERSAPVPATFSDGELRAALLSQWDALLRGETDATAQLSEAQRRLDEQLARQRERRDTPAPPIAVATPEMVPAGTDLVIFGVPSGTTGDLQPLIDRFARDNPTIRVKPRLLDAAESTDAITTPAPGYDCFIWPGLPTASQQTALLDLAPLADADTSFDRADYPGGVLGRFRQDGALVGIPYTLRLRALVYNQALFERQGIALPAPDWTLDDLVATAQQLTNRGSNPPQYGYGQTFRGPEDLRIILALSGASVAKAEGGDLQPDFTNPAAVEAIRRYTALLTSSSPYTELAGYKRSQLIPDVLSAGQTGMWFTDLANGYLFDASTATLKAALAVPPRDNQGGILGDVSLSGLYISATSRVSQSCWTWLSFLSRQPGALSGTEFPARRSVATSAVFRASILPGSAELYDAYLPILERDAATANDVFFDDPQVDTYWLYRAIDRAMQGNALEGELRQAEDLTRQHLACVQQGRRPGACARLVDTDYAGLKP